MKMSPYLSFRGDCEEAFEFYVRHLGATAPVIHRYGGSPMAGDVPPEWGHKVMHGGITIGGQELMAADVVNSPAPQGFSLSLQPADVAEGQRIFDALADGGTITVPFAPTFWAGGFGMVIDRFGVPWLINCEGAAASQA